MSEWTFITNHGMVLILISRTGQITTREIASELGITERSVQRIIKDLEAAGYVRKQRIGRRNHYAVNPDAPLRWEHIRDASVGSLLQSLKS